VPSSYLSVREPYPRGDDVALTAVSTIRKPAETGSPWNRELVAEDLGVTE
jgi:hypothetical protein